MKPTEERAGSTASPWPRRLAVATVLAATPLVLFGGSVTTLGAGMAVDGWLVAEGHFLLLFPVESWLRDTATFVEHTHRLFGVLVGLLAIATAAAAWARARGAGAWTATAALVAVAGQGALGGFRVLEDSPRLAFLHGFVAQAVFALLGATAVVLAPRFRRPERDAAAPAGARRAAAAACAVVLAQVLVGAAYRHALRPAPGAGVDLLLGLHFVGAATALAATLWLAAALSSAAGPLAVARRRLLLLVHLQIVLGLLAWAGRASAAPGTVGPLEWTCSILHVLGGALLLAQCVAAALWAFRLPVSEAAGAAAAAPELGGAR